MTLKLRTISVLVLCSALIAAAYAVAGNISLIVMAVFFVAPILLRRLWTLFSTMQARVVTVTFFVSTSAVVALPANWRDPLAPAVFLFAIGLLVVCFSSIVLLFRRFKIASSILACLVSFFISFSVVFLFFGPLLPPAGMKCPEYRLLIQVAKDGSISGNHRMVLAMDWKDEGDIVRTANGEIAGWRDQTQVAKYLSDSGYDDWTIEDARIIAEAEDGQFQITVMLTKPKLEMEVQKAGWFRNIATIQTSRHVYGFGDGRAQDIRFTVEMPNGFSLSHNLNGTFSESVLDTGEVGKRLVADEILSHGGDTIMLSYLTPAMQSVPVRWLSGFSTWMIFASLGSFSFGMALALARPKNNPTKSIAVRVLRRVKLLPEAPSVFISYRRVDSQEVVGRVYDRLSAIFGASHVFKDVDSIPLGDDFRQEISSAVSSCDVLLAVIGGNWLNTTDDFGEQRLRNSSDYVRVEIESALGNHIPVIPVLVGNAVLPTENELPESLRPLAFSNAAQIRPDPDFQTDVDRLIRGIEDLTRRNRGITIR